VDLTIPTKSVNVLYFPCLFQIRSIGCIEELAKKRGNRLFFKYDRLVASRNCKEKRK